jgi:hypothetical protein
MVNRFALIAGLITLSPLSLALARADEEAIGVAAWEPRAQVVVLRNGSVIQGRVEESRDRLIVSNGPWYVVRVPVADVDFVAPDWAAAYRTRRARLAEGDFQQHLQLAQWCLRHDLDRFAGDELLHLAHLDPHHSSVKGLEQQLRRRANDEPSRPGSAVEPMLPRRRDHRSPRRSSLEPTGDELPLVPAEALAEFTRSIQPLLLNRCGQTTCHGSAGRSRFYLQRLTASGDVRRALTLRNLREAIAQIDATQPDKSPLLAQAIRPHASFQRAPLGPHDSRQYERLLEWVTWVTNGEPVTTTVADDPLAAPAETAVSAANSGVPAAPRLKPAPAPPGTNAATGVEPAESSTDTAATATDIDPYDPAEFNARFSVDRSTTDEGS